MSKFKFDRSNLNKYAGLCGYSWACYKPGKSWPPTCNEDGKKQIAAEVLSFIISCIKFDYMQSFSQLKEMSLVSQDFINNCFEQQKIDFEKYVPGCYINISNEVFDKIEEKISMLGQDNPEGDI